MKEHKQRKQRKQHEQHLFQLQMQTQHQLHSVFLFALLIILQMYFINFFTVIVFPKVKLSSLHDPLVPLLAVLF
jgi:hypothetical protein